MIIAVTGGKGGTGKSTVATALAYELSMDKNILLVDADVDCPNDHLILSIKRDLLKEIYQRIPRFELDKCIKCGACGRVCKTKAIVSIPDKSPIFIENQCNGCGACKIVCPSNAIIWDSKKIGRIYSGRKGRLTLLSGELEPYQPVSEFIVNHLNEEIKKAKDKFDYIIVDTAAGTHCPVIAALENVDEVLAVTEPTPLGAHDLEIILRLLVNMGKKGRIIINRADISSHDIIIPISKKYNTKIAFEIPYSKEIVSAYSKGIPFKIDNLLNVIKEGKK